MIKSFLEKIFIKKNTQKQSINPLCYAPFNNLLIDQQGNFKICCHNNTYILGKYPEQSIDDIWFGNKRKAIIQEFLDQKIPESCKHCIEKGININSPDSKIHYSRENKIPSFNNYPHQIEFLLSNKCNLDCIMCADNISSSSNNIHPKSSLRNKKTIIFDTLFIEQLKPYLKKVKYSVFSGGEPFLIPIYEKIWEIISKKNPTSTIYVQTNGTILNDKIKEMLSKYRLNIGISIDSLQKNTYETIRRNAHFEKTLSNLNYFIEHSKSIHNNITMMFTPMTINAIEVPNIISFCNSKEINFSLSILEWPVHLAIWSLPSSKIEEIIEKYQTFEIQESSQIPIILKNNKSFRYFKELVEEYARQKRFFEKHQSIIENNILKLCTNAASNFSNEMEATAKQMNLSKELAITINQRSRKLIVKYYELFSTKFSHPEFFYVFFIKTPKPIFIEHLQKYDDALIEKILEEKMDELAFLLQSKSYNRIIDFESYD